MKILMTAVLLAAGFSPVIAGDLAKQGNSFAALTAQTNKNDIKIPSPTTPAKVKDKTAQQAQSWTDAAKAAYEKALDDGGLTVFADLKELPPGARRQLEQELQTLPQGPGNSSEAFKMAVNGRTAFVVQSYIYSDSLRVYIFNAAGVLVARGEGSSDTPLKWLPLP
ncbi:MAG: hypothetical protein NTX59_06515 [Elusimicrobia bacterium]|nr:hypothetical protein [Elusimicrobiota bacterium]